MAAPQFTPGTGAASSYAAMRGDGALANHALAGHHPELDDRLDRHRDGLNAHAARLDGHDGALADHGSRLDALEGSHPAEPSGEPDADDS